MEIETQIDICERLKYLAQSDTESISKEITETSKMLTSLMSKIK